VTDPAGTGGDPSRPASGRAGEAAETADGAGAAREAGGPSIRRPRLDRPWTAPLAGGFAAGFVAGLFGIGGGVLLIPVLVLVLRRSQHVAHATSLLAMTIPATVAAARFSLDDAVAWIGAAAIVGGSLVGVRIGAAILPRIPERRLKLLFAGFLGVLAVRLLIFGDASLVAPTAASPELSLVPVLVHAALGLLVGVTSAVLGIGGGSVIVPALVLFYGYDQHLAEGTSLAVIVPTALLGAVSHARHGYTDWPVGLRLGLGGLVGGPLGAELALALPAGVLARGFALLLIVVVGLMFRDR
jgi:uncharacterized protein